jgi:hypothetical protein
MKKTFNLRQIKARLPFWLIVFVLLSCTTPQAAGTPFENNTVPKELGKPVLINLNGYYFLYMHPIPPFQSEERVFVPLYHFTNLLAVGTMYEYGADVEKPPLSVLLTRGNIEVAINNKSVVTITNTKTGQKTTPAYSGNETIWRELEDNLYGVYVALDIFKDAFGIEVKYDAATDTVYVVDTEYDFTGFLQIDELLYKVQATPIIRPIKFSLEVTNEPKNYEDSAFKLTLEIQASDDYTGKAEDISVALLAFYPGAGVLFTGNSTIKPFTCQNGTKKNQFVCVENLPPEQEFKSPLWYIFSRMGVRIK